MQRYFSRINWKKCKYKLTFGQFVVLAIIMVIFWNEYFSFLLSRMFWSSELQSKRNTGEIRILFVADPQLQGYHDVYLSSQLLTDIAIWDADRYLSHGYKQAYNYLKPDVVVFLGDLLDEGSTAIDLEYKECVNRFYDIFTTDPGVKNIYISGDNDIGGEGFDRKTDSKIKRFMSAFPVPKGENTEHVAVIQSVNNLDFIKLNLDWGESLDSKKIKSLEDAMKASKGKYRIIVNHMDLLYNQRSIILQNVLRIIKPHLIVAGHTHDAMYVKCPGCSSTDTIAKNPKIDITHINSNKVYHTQFLMDTKKGGISEFIVPTCSYRMGVESMGYGAAILDTNTGEMRYTVLWQPSRHKHFAIYVITLVLFFIFSVIKCFSLLVKS